MSKRQLSPRYRRIVELRRSGKKLQEIGRIMGFSRQRAWQLYHRAMRRLKTAA